MKAIELQTKPFIHVDNDVYLWEALPDSTNREYLITQSRFPIWNEYKSSLNEIFANFSYVPDCLQERPSASTMVANVGLIGGNDLDFFREFCQTSSQLLERNRNFLSFVDIGGFNQMMEEYLFTSLARFKNRQVYYLLENPGHSFPPSHLNFELVPVVYKYIHLIGMHKQNRVACEQLALRLKYEFPQYYERIMDVASELTGLDDDHAFADRQEMIERALAVFYTHKLSDIRNMKVCIKRGCEIVSATDFTSDRSVSYLCKEYNSRTGGYDYRTLPAFSFEHAHHWLPFLNESISINEILEALREKLRYENGLNFSAFSSQIIQAITANILLIGVLEFADGK